MVYILKKILFSLIILFSIGCKNDTELSMERGIQFYEWDLLEKAILEFNYVIHNLGNKTQKLDYNEIKLLSRAHHNLAVAYAKKKWYVDAIDEASKAFALFPTDDNRKVLELIQTKNSEKEKLGTAPISSSP